VKIAIVGSGLAGLTAAVNLVDEGHEVEIYESRSFWGGKVGSWEDKDGNHIEMGLHVFFYNYANLFKLMKKVGALDNLLPKDHTHLFINNGGNLKSLDFRFPLGAPFNGLKAFFTTEQLTWVDKFRNALALGTSPIVRGLIDYEGAMKIIRDLDRISFKEWFLNHGGSEKSLERIKFSLKDILFLAQGGTAVGTGLNTKKNFDKKITREISKYCNIPFKPAPNKFSELAAHDAIVSLSGSLNSCAVALMKISNYYIDRKIDLGKLRNISELKTSDYSNKLVLCPPSSLSDRWSQRFRKVIKGFVSGWMGIKQRIKQKNIQLPIVISDHADWNEILKTIEEISPEKVLVTHGREEGLLSYLKQKKVTCNALNLIGFEDEDD